MRRLLVLIVASLVGMAVVAGPVVAKPPKDPKKAKEQITEAFACFLSGALGYTTEQKLACVDEVTENPEFLALAVELQEANAGAADITEPQINSIKFRSSKRAAVDFNLIVGESDLGTQDGSAVLVTEDGKKLWKVSAQTFCNLAVLGRPDAEASGPCAEVLAGG